MCLLDPTESISSHHLFTFTMFSDAVVDQTISEPKTSLVCRVEVENCKIVWWSGYVGGDMIPTVFCSIARV